MSTGDIGMRAQPALELVLAGLAKNWVERIDGDTALGTLQILGKLDERDRRIRTGAQEESGGEPGIVNLTARGIRCAMTGHDRP